MAAVIFDFDGTLADTFPLVVDVTYELSGARRLSAARIEPLRRLPLLQAVRALGVSYLALPRLIVLTRRHMYPRMGEVPAFAGIEAMVRDLHAAGHKLYILSSNRWQNIQVFLTKHQLSPYFEGGTTVYYGNAFYKVYGLHKLMRQYHLAADDCYYIGNEALDLRAAKRTGIRAVGITWSGHTHDSLAVTEPFAVVDKPHGIVTLVGQK